MIKNLSEAILLRGESYSEETPKHLERGWNKTK